MRLRVPGGVWIGRYHWGQNDPDRGKGPSKDWEAGGQVDVWRGLGRTVRWGPAAVGPCSCQGPLDVPPKPLKSPFSWLDVSNFYFTTRISVSEAAGKVTDV